MDKDKNNVIVDNGFYSVPGLFFVANGEYVGTVTQRSKGDERSREVHERFVGCADVCTTPGHLEKPSGRPRPLAAAAYSVVIRIL